MSRWNAPNCTGPATSNESFIDYFELDEDEDLLENNITLICGQTDCEYSVVKSYDHHSAHASNYVMDVSRGGCTTAAPSTNPTDMPSALPTTAAPSTEPTSVPSDGPTVPTFDPTTDPTSDPTSDPTADPTSVTTAPSYDPTSDPTSDPTDDPTSDPTSDPTEDPTAPTDEPTSDPSSDPTTAEPTAEPTTGAPTMTTTSSTTTTEDMTSTEEMMSTEECDNWGSYIDCELSDFEAASTDWRETAVVLHDCFNTGMETFPGVHMHVDYVCLEDGVTQELYLNSDCSGSPLDFFEWEGPGLGVCPMAVCPTPAPTTTSPTAAPVVAQVETTVPAPTDPPSDDGAADKDKLNPMDVPNPINDHPLTFCF